MADETTADATGVRPIPVAENQETVTGDIDAYLPQLYTNARMRWAATEAQKVLKETPDADHDLLVLHFLEKRSAGPDRAHDAAEGLEETETVAGPYGHPVPLEQIIASAGHPDEPVRTCHPDHAREPDGGSE